MLAGFGPLFIDSEDAVKQNMRLPVFGGVPEWPKGADCKSAVSTSEVRILPPPPYLSERLERKMACKAGVV